MYKLITRAGMDPVFYYLGICLWVYTWIIALKIHSLFAVKYKVLSHPFAHVFTDHFALHKSKKLVTWSKNLLTTFT